MCKQIHSAKCTYLNAKEIIVLLSLSLQLVICNDLTESNFQMENPKISWPDPNRDRDRRQVGLGSLSHDGSHGGDHGDRRSDSISVSDGSRSSITSPSRNKDELAPRRQYPNRSYGRSSGFSNNQQFNDPSSTFRQQSRQNSNRQGSDGTFAYDPYGPSRQASNSSYTNRGQNINQANTKSRATTRRAAQLKGAKNNTQLKSGRKDTTKDPFEDPDRYRVPQLEQAADNVRFVNGRPYR